MSPSNKKSIYLKQNLSKVNASTLLDGGATKSSVSRKFLKRCHMSPAHLDQSLVSKLSEGVTEIAYKMFCSINVQEQVFQEQFYVIHQESSQPIVLGFDFLQIQHITIAYGQQAGNDGWMSWSVCNEDCHH